jgi:sugar phosphate isomerase/epimerase
MDLKIGLKLWSVNTDAYQREAERLYADGTFSYIELFVVPGTGNTLDAWRRLHDEKGVPFIIHNAHAAQGFNLADESAERKNVEIYRETRKFADVLDARYVIFHGGVDGSVKETARQLKALEEPRALLENKPLAPLANPFGVKECRGATVDEIGFVINEVGCGFCLDVGHAVCAANSLSMEPYGYVRELARRFSPAMYHLSDVCDTTSPCDSHLHLGGGALDIPRVCREIFPINACITLETPKWRTDDLVDFELDVRVILEASYVSKGGVSC